MPRRPSGEATHLMITVSSENENELLTFKVGASTSADEIRDYISSSYKDAKRLVLWDFSGTDLSHLSSAELLSITATGKEFATHEKTAFVGDSDLEFGLLSMYRSHSENSGTKANLMVFKTVAEALTWLYSTEQANDSLPWIGTARLAAHSDRRQDRGTKEE